MGTREIQAGEAVGLDWGPAGHVDYIAQPSCHGAEGHWVCAKHPAADTRNNMMMDSHLAEGGEHVEVWVCGTHGPESPH